MDSQGRYYIGIAIYSFSKDLPKVQKAEVCLLISFIPGSVCLIEAEN
jgi:hypothetical protein